MHIGILQTGHAPDQVRATQGDVDGMFMRLLDGHGFTFQTYPVVDDVFPEGPETADGWLITGSKHGAYEDLPWIKRLEELIRAIKEAGRPMVGVCFGHQIIAQALGGHVEKFEGGWAIGRQTYDYAGREVSVNAWHQDQVTQLPPGATVTARSDFCANAGFVLDDSVWTIQPHPEFSTDVIDGLLTHRAPGVVPDALIDEARTRLDIPTERLEVGADMARFFKRGASHV